MIFFIIIIILFFYFLSFIFIFIFIFIFLKKKSTKVTKQHKTKMWSGLPPSKCSFNVI